MEAEQIQFEDELADASALITIDGVTLDPNRDFVPKDTSTGHVVDFELRSAMTKHLYEKNTWNMNMGCYGLEMVIPRFMVDQEYVLAVENMLEEALGELRREAEEDRQQLRKIVRDEARQLGGVVHRTRIMAIGFSGSFKYWTEILVIIDEVMTLADSLCVERRLRPSQRSDYFNKYRNRCNRLARKVWLERQMGFQKMLALINRNGADPHADRSNDRNRLILAKRDASRHRKERRRNERAQESAQNPSAGAGVQGAVATAPRQSGKPVQANQKPTKAAPSQPVATTQEARQQGGQRELRVDPRQPEQQAPASDNGRLRQTNGDGTRGHVPVTNLDVESVTALAPAPLAAVPVAAAAG